MSKGFVIIKMCYVHNQWYDISCATLYLNFIRLFPTIRGTYRVANNVIHNISALSNSHVLFLFLGKFSFF